MASGWKQYRNTIAFMCYGVLLFYGEPERKTIKSSIYNSKEFSYIISINNSFKRKNNMSIANLAAQFCARSTKPVNVATMDDEIKVQVAALDAFDHQGQLRSLVSNDVVDSATISQAKTLVENLGKLSYSQKQEILKQLKDMTDAAEKQIMSKLLAASANSGETTITGLVNAANAPEPEPEVPAQESVSAVQVNGLGDVGSLIATLLGAAFQPAAPVTPAKHTVVNGVDVDKVKELVAGQGVDFSALRKAFNIQ